MYNYFFKRLIDIVLSLLGLVILFFPMLIIVVLIKIDDPGPAFFKQTRIGKHKKKFQLYKFRSMKINTPDIPTHLLENPQEYLIGIGAIIRKLSIDELPQLFNILKGDMSIIGPRPALWNQNDLIFERDKYGANNIKPGLTGFAQINGRDELEISEKAFFDGEYAKNMCFIVDAKLFFGTIRKVVSFEGVVEGGTGKLNSNQ